MYTREEIEAAGLDDFRVFLAQVWDFVLPGEDPTPTQYDIAYWLQHGPDRVVLEAFRGVGKSWITAAFALWHLFLDPQKKIEIVSASQSLADDISKFMKQIIHGMDLLQHLAPRQDQRNSALSFDVGPATPSKDPSVKSAGITGQITGTRADIIIADDIEIPKNSFTHHLREKLSEQVKEFSAILKPDSESSQSRIIYLGTPQVEESLYTKLPERGYTVRIYPAEIPKHPENYNGTLAPYVQRMIDNGAEPGTPVDPERFDRDDLDKRLADYAKSGYALQFMLDTNPSSAEKHPLKLSDLIVTDIDDEMGHVKMVWGREKSLRIEDLAPGGFSGDYYHRPAWKSDEMAKWSGTVMAIDPSGRGKDELAYAIVKNLHSMLYLVDVGGMIDGYSEETLKTLAVKGARYGVNKVITETNFGGGMFNELLKPYLADMQAGKLDEEWNGWSSSMKEARILSTLEPVLQQHRLVVDRRVIEKDLKVQSNPKTSKYSLVYQLTRMENVKGALPHEDRLEAVAMACEYWVERMNQSRDKAVDKHKQKLLDEEIKNFMKNAINVGAKRSGGLIWH